MKRLVKMSVMVLSIVTIASVQAEGPVRYDKHGNAYVHKGSGPVFGSMNKVLTGSNRRYINDEQPRNNKSYKRNRNNNRGDQE